MLSVKCMAYEGSFPFGLGDMAPYGMSNEEVINYGTLQGLQKAQQTRAAKALRALPKVAIGTFILGSAIKQSGKLSDKLSRALLTTGEFTILAAGLKVFDKIANKCVKKSTSAQEFEKDHPAVSAALGLGAAFLAMGLALFGAKRLVDLTAKKCPKIAQNITKELKKAADFIDKKSMAKRVENFKVNYQNFAKKRGRIYKFATENVFPIGILGYIAAGIGLGRKNAKEKDEFIQQSVIETAQKRDLMNLMASAAPN